jgi:rhamnulose-1-phosphate aldolase/alcohol dehydrogenase
VAATTQNRLTNRWSKADAPKDGADLLVYASNLLGSDAAITNYGGGNTSSKTLETDPLTGERVEVLWVKASGGDLGTAKRAGFASLYQGKLLGLEARYRAGVTEDEMVPLYAQCSFNLNPAAPSIDTPLHSYVPFKCVSHMHPDAVIAVAASANSEELTQTIFKGKLGWLPWKRPGFELGLQLQELLAKNPGIEGAILGSHGLICWTDDWESCYDLTLRLIDEAQEYIDSRNIAEPFGKAIRNRFDSDAAAKIAELLPSLRGKVTHEGKRLIAHVDSSDEVLDYLASEKLEKLANLGTSCPDHFLRTKIRPLVFQEGDNLDEALGDFRKRYAEYYDRCKRPDSPAIRNPNPSVVLLPGLGMVSFGKSATEARVTGEFYKNAINVMRGAEAMSQYSALPEQEAFDIEYWALEEAKLRRQPPEKEFARQIVAITGGAQGIGRSTALKLAALGATVVLLDINEEKLATTGEEVASAAGSKDSVQVFRCNVTDPQSLAEAFGKTVLAFGGLDVVVVNAGNARRGTIVDTSPDDYKFLSDLLMKGYFDTMAEATRLLMRQGIGGCLVVVGSKNGVAVGSNAALYSAAKAFELHLMRTVALDFAKHGIRCNAVNPDGVVQGSGIWSDAWKEQTAKSLGVAPDDLVEYYRKRSLLGVSVTPDDCAEAIVWLASEARSSRTTGAVVPVDGGNREGLLR